MSECNCNEKFRTAEDYRDHLPCMNYSQMVSQTAANSPSLPYLPLAFADLTRGNKERIPLFKNAKGDIAHPKTKGIDGSDWSLLEWSGAVAGEVGELANLCKKVRRGDVSLEDMMEDKGKMLSVREIIAREAVDAVCYLDIICIQVGVDMGEAVREKFNSVSDRSGVPVKI